MTANEPKSEKHFEYWDETDRVMLKVRAPDNKDRPRLRYFTKNREPNNP